jgi:DNA-binding HxlR family transcriptional regulator
MTSPVPRPSHAECEVREILARIWDKWSVAVVWRLGEGPYRFSELRKTIEGISERMLTVTLRRLERDGLVGRTVFPVVPPRVEYQLTEMGTSLLATVSDLFRWTDDHVEMITKARAVYDSRVAQEFPSGTPSALSHKRPLRASRTCSRATTSVARSSESTVTTPGVPHRPAQARRDPGPDPGGPAGRARGGSARRSQRH